MTTDEDLERLRRADPIAPSSLPSAHGRRARALFEEITMSDVITSTESTERSGAPRRRPATPWIAGVAAAVALVVAIGAAVAVGRDDQPEPSGVAGAPITPGGSAGASCVELYEPATLAHREVAFDGTVAAIEGDLVTFTVNRAYRGVDGRRVTLEGATALSGLTSAGPGAALEVGARLLVAGDGGFAWSCGFTQPFDEAVADQWASAFRGQEPSR